MSTGIFTTAELTELRRERERDMSDLFTLLREPARTGADKGEAPDVAYPGGWISVATGIRGRISTTTKRSEERTGLGGVIARGEYLLNLSYTDASPLTIFESDRFHCTSQGRHFEIRGIPDTSGTLTEHGKDSIRQIEADEIKT